MENLVADLALVHHATVVQVEFLSPSRRREAIEQVGRVLPVSERRTCRVLVQHRSR